jgi:hypothetical protein
MMSLSRLLQLPKQMKHKDWGVRGCFENERQCVIIIVTEIQGC